FTVNRIATSIFVSWDGELSRSSAWARERLCRPIVGVRAKTARTGFPALEVGKPLPHDPRHPGESRGPRVPHMDPGSGEARPVLSLSKDRDDGLKRASAPAM